MGRLGTGVLIGGACRGSGIVRNVQTCHMFSLNLTSAGKGPFLIGK